MPAITALAKAGFEIPLVVTAPPARRSRRGKATPTPVGQAAQTLGLTVSHSIADVADGDVAADCVMVVAFGQLISADLLARLPMLNLHFSMLPRWRGAAPVERALLAGDTHVGVCLMEIETKLDTGPVYWYEQVEVNASATATELRAKLADVGAQRLVSSLQEGLDRPTPQQGDPTYAKKLTRTDRQLQWDMPASQLERVVRVGQAWTTIAGNELKIHEAQVRPMAECESVPASAEAGSLWVDAVRCGEDALVLVTVQPSGRSAMAAADWLRGARLAPGAVLGT